MIGRFLLHFICLIHITIEIEILVVTDVKRNISSLYVDNFDTRVYCTMNEEPIKLDILCNFGTGDYLSPSIPVKPFTWNYHYIQSNKIKEWRYWDWGKTTVYLYLYTSDRNVTYDINVNNETRQFKTQILTPFEWHDLSIESNSNETKLLNGTLHCLDTLPFTYINRIRINSDKLIFWKFGLDYATMVPKQNTFLYYINSSEQVRFLQYNYCENNYTLYREDNNEQIQMTKRGNWYILPPVNGTLKLYGHSACDNSFISRTFSCPYTNYLIYTFAYDSERSISCLVDEKNITVKLTKSSKYTKDITTSMALSIKGNYICNKSGCYCKDGYQGDNCNSECEKYSWGRKCEKKCGKCLNKEYCDKINGECKQCQEGYINSKCKDFVDIEFDVYSKNEKAAWIRWKIKDINKISYDIFLNANGNHRKVNMDKNCDLWSNYTNYICSFVELTISNKYNIVKFEINIDNKNYAIKSLNVYAKEEPSESPLNLRQQEKNIIWKHPLITNGQIREFLIKVSVLHSGFLENKSVFKWLKIKKHKREYEIQYNLVKTISEFNKRDEEDVIQFAPATVYSITVRVLNLYTGKESNSLVITTEITTPTTINKIYDCGKEFEITNLLRDSDVYLVKTVISKEQIKSNLLNSVRNAFKLENKDFSHYYHEIDETGLLKKSKLGNQSTKITVQCAKRKDDTYFTVVVINRFNLKETHLLINIDRVWIYEKSIPLGIIISVVLLVLIVIGIGVGIYFKMWTRFNWNSRNRSTNTSNYLDVKYSKSPQNFNLDDPIPIEKLNEYIKRCFENGDEIKHLFNNVPKSFNYSMDYGLKNPSKNRFKNILPYDYNRVVLNKADEENYKYYINASYIDGYENKKAYIATQAPTKNTIYDFWKMIIQENVHYMVMLVNLFENNKHKCEQYWPMSRSVSFRDITVTLIKHQVVDSKHSCREFEVSQNNVVRKVQHFQFIDCFKFEKVDFRYIKFLKIINSLPSASPIVIHCSSGVGITGVVILTDIAIKMAEAEEIISFTGILNSLRKQRLKLVETFNQFFLCHLSVYEFFNYNDFSITVGEHFASVFEHQYSQVNNSMAYLRRMEWLDKQICYDDSDEMTTTNRPKNRLQNILPGKLQVYIDCYPSDNSESDYINAVRVDCYGNGIKFICTQQPLANTVGDFWRLVDQYGIKAIVSLNDFNLKEKPVWPQIGEVLNPVDYLKVKLSSHQENEYFQMQKLYLENLRQQDSTNLTVFNMKNWVYPKQTPADPKSIINLWNNACLNENILVVCRDGCTASGVFFATAFVMEQIKTDSVCDIVQAIRTIRRSRVEFISSEKQLTFISKVAKQFAEESPTYETLDLYKF